MVIDRNKVTILPRNSKKASQEFICSCPTCIEKERETQTISSGVEEVRSIIDDLIGSTSLSTKDFDINISYADSDATIVDYSKQLGKIKNMTQPSELAALFSYIKSLSTFTDTFNKKYRHPMICRLEDRAGRLLQSMSTYSNLNASGLLEARLWQFQKILSLALESLSILQAIEGENFIEHVTIEKLIKKSRNAKIKTTHQLKKMFKQALSVPDFQPACTIDDFQLNYYI